MIKTIIEDYNLDKVDILVEKDTNLKYQATSKDIVRNFIIEENATLEYIGFLNNELTEELNIRLIGENAKVDVNILALGINTKMKIIQNIIHEAKNTISNITNFAIALSKANLDFRTTGHVLNKMSKSNCRQLCRGIIIGEDSKITSEPILLIDEFDVMASHGAAIGKMSDEEMFYLMSRGLTKEESLSLIVEGLVKPFIAKLENKEDFEELINKTIRGN